MHTYLNHCEIVNAQGANEYGFVIEEDVAFIFDLGNEMVGCLGQVTDGPNRHWQFDTILADLSAMQFIEKDLQKALKKAEHITTEIRKPSKFLISDRLVDLGMEHV